MKAKPGAWYVGTEPPPYKMLVCAVEAVGQFYDFLYFVGYYSPEDRRFVDPCSGIKYARNVVYGWRIFAETLNVRISHEEQTAPSQKRNSRI